MTDEPRAFRILAESPNRPGDLIVEDPARQPRLFIGSTGTISQSPLNAGLVQAMLRGSAWRKVQHDRWYSIDELREDYAAG
jgi:hypothetical protein